MFQCERIATLRELRTKKNIHEGQTVFCDENQEFYIFHDGQLEKLEPYASTADGVSMQLYELNKQIISQLPALTEEQLQNSMKLFNDYHDAVQNNNYLLLCREYSYITLFSQEDDAVLDFGFAVISIISELGVVHSIEKSSNDAIEIWITPEGKEEAMVFYLFGYDAGIVGYGG